MFDKLLRRLVKGSPTETDGVAPLSECFEDTLVLQPEVVVDADDTGNGGYTGDDAALPEATALSFTFICRETVVDRTQKVVGYEYLLRNSVLQREQFSDPVQQYLDEQALLSRLVTMDLARLLEYRYTFITLSAQVILRPIVERR